MVPTSLVFWWGIFNLRLFFVFYQGKGFLLRFELSFVFSLSIPAFFILDPKIDGANVVVAFSASELEKFQWKFPRSYSRDSLFEKLPFGHRFWK